MSVGEREAAHPFGAGAGFTGAAAAEDQPGGPVGAAVGAFWRKLVVVGEGAEIALKGRGLLLFQRQQQLRHNLCLRRRFERR